MFEKITPEQAGIASGRIAEYISMLERRGLSMHGLLLMKGDRIFAEYYWAPFDKDFCHRMYSETKSYVGIAIGLLAEDGKLSLDDRIADHFPEKADGEIPAELQNQTIREMLIMCTCGNGPRWFTSGDPDRTHLYFQPRTEPNVPGTIWMYDSAGSQVLGVLVEKLSGKRLFDFLDERIFSHLGTFRTAQMLQTPNGDTWADSSMLCTLRDMASFGRLLMKGGNWEGRQLISADYVKEAVSAQADNRLNGRGNIVGHGYGYQIWRFEGNTFGFNGMGGQFTVCDPDHDLLFAVMADNQGNPAASHIVLGGFFDLIAAHAKPEPLPEDPAAFEALQKLGQGLTLYAVKGNADSPLREEISGKTWLCGENPLGMKKFSFVFDGTEGGEFRYTNEQGDKVIPFGINRNRFGFFPQLGYSNDRGGMRTTDGFQYRDAVSLCWAQDNRILMHVQIIDRYMGNMSAVFGFNGNYATCLFDKSAEDFLDEYSGRFLAMADDGSGAFHW